MKIYIIRHGETSGNKKALLQGRGSDSPLNENGVEQAREAGRLLSESGVRFERVISSPLVRALDTARIVSGTEPEIDERLIEMECGPYEGADLKNIPQELKIFFSDFVNNPAPEGMESLGDICRRSEALLEDLKHTENTGNVLLSTHAIAMKGLLEVLTPGSNGSYWSKYIENCVLYVTELNGGKYTAPEYLQLTGEE